MSLKRRNNRLIEIYTGLFLTFSVVSFLLAYLVSFDYVIPNASIKDDIEFLAETIASQRLSAIAWIVTGVFYLFFLPIYLIMFHRFQKGMHIFNSMLILVMAYSFFKLGLTELHIAKISLESFSESLLISPEETTRFLISIREVYNLSKIGITAFGAFATVFTIAKFSNVKFPLFGSTLAFLAGPIVVAFTWINSDHILLTVGLALSWAGLLIIGAYLVNKGMEIKKA